MSLKKVGPEAFYPVLKDLQQQEISLKDLIPIDRLTSEIHPSLQRFLNSLT